jgi:ABC-2 type transport system permease protein
MSEPASTASIGTAGVIHDIGYQRYQGPRLGRAYAVRSLYIHGLRTAFGLGRSAKAKIFPWIVAGLVGLVAVVLMAIRTQTPGAEPVLPYWQFPNAIVMFVILFCAVVGPELVSRDLRGGVLPLYFSRPLTRSDYALAKFGALVTAVFLLIAGPQLVMFIGGAFTVDGLGAVWDEAADFAEGLAVAATYAVTFAALSILIASLAGRRAVAAAMIVALFLVTTPIYGVLVGIAYSQPGSGELTASALTLTQVAGLVSPMTLVDGVARWWFDVGRPLGPYGPLYGLVNVALVAFSVLLLLLRYRKVAR